MSIATPYTCLLSLSFWICSPWVSPCCVVGWGFWFFTKCLLRNTLVLTLLFDTGSHWQCYEIWRRKKFDIWQISFWYSGLTQMLKSLRFHGKAQISHVRGLGTARDSSKCSTAIEVAFLLSWWRRFTVQMDVDIQVHLWHSETCSLGSGITALQLAKMLSLWPILTERSSSQKI